MHEANERQAIKVTCDERPGRQFHSICATALDVVSLLTGNRIQNRSFLIVALLSFHTGDNNGGW
jgi:hypothetical protein